MAISVPGAFESTGTYAMPIFFFRKGAGDPLVTRPAVAPPIETVQPSRAISRSCISKPTRVRSMPVSFLRDQDVAPQKFSLVRFADPAQIRFPCRRRVVNFMPVEAHAGFQAQRVARAQAAGQHSFGWPASSRSFHNFSECSGAK